jgi:hypothetical protein
MRGMTDAGAALEKALVDACLEARAGESIVSDLRGFLEARGVPADDVAAILEAPPRMGVYRTLVRSGLLSVVSSLMPRTRARMNAVCDARFDVDFARFLHERAPQTHYLRDVPSEFFAWVKPQWDGDASVRSYLVDLAAHELTCFELASVEAPLEAAPVTEVDLARPAVLSARMKLVRYRWAVHELPDGSDSAIALADPEPRDVALVGYRDAEHAVHWLELTPLAAGIVDRLAAGDPIGVAVERTCEEQGAAADLKEVARLLADLGARGILLGGAPS